MVGMFKSDYNAENRPLHSRESISKNLQNRAKNGEKIVVLKL